MTYVASCIFSVLFVLSAIIFVEAQATPPQINAVYREGYDVQNSRNAIALRRLAPGLSKQEEANDKFLSQKKTGILFLSVKLPCSLKQNAKSGEFHVMTTDDLDKVAKKCPARNFKGEAQHYSFRRRYYTLPDQADLSYNGNALYSNGMLANGVVASLGDISIDTLSLNSKGISGLRDLVAAKNPLEANERQKMIEKGFVVDGIPYTRGVIPKLNITYALRVIAYNVPYEKVNTYLGGGRTSSPLSGDERADIIVAFRIIAIDESGLTVIWKELQRKSSPFLKSEPK